MAKAAPQTRVGKFLSRVDWKVVSIVSIMFLAATIIVRQFFGGFKELLGIKDREERKKKKKKKGGGEIPKGWEPDGIASGLFDAIDGVWDSSSSINSAFRKFNALNDNQMIAVYNYWQKHYANRESGSIFSSERHGTLTHSLADESFKTDEQKKALSKLRSLGLP